jgi:nucleoside-diphosphate-sugar epimerase
MELGYQVQGSTTTPAKLNWLAEQGIKPFLINLGRRETDQNLITFLEASILIVSFPPGIRAGNGPQYLQQIKALTQALCSAPVKNLLFISSTSVYPELNRVVSEAENLATYSTGNFLLQGEELILQLNNIQTTVLRLGGLVGGNRHPGRFLSGKQNLDNPNSPVNLIHQDDCVNLITGILQQNKWGEIYNGCADEHPTRQEFYTAAAQKLHLPLPQFNPPAPSDNYKIFSNEKIKKDLSYRFIHPDPMLFL